VKEIEAGIDVRAPADVVWQVLLDFERYPEWNPFIRNISGDARAGGRLRVHVAPSGERGLTFRPRVLVAEPGRELRWRGRLFVPGLFDGEHAFVITPHSPTSCRLVQSERFSGVLVALTAGTMSGTRDGFERMNRALRRRAEGIAGTRH
jgi:hypothetical protein